MDTGWIKLHRKFLESPLWNYSRITHKPIYIKIWLYLLMSVNYEAKKWYNGKEEVEIPAGSIITSISHLAENCQTTPQTIRTILTQLENMKMLTRRSTNKFTILLIVNWSKYQSRDVGDNKQNNEQLTNEQQTTNKPLTTTKEYKNIRIKEEEGDFSKNKREILLLLNNRDFLREKSEQFNLDLGRVRDEIKLCADWWDESKKVLKHPKAALNNWLRKVSPNAQSSTTRIDHDNQITENLPQISEEERLKIREKFERKKEELLKLRSMPNN